jgi:hypothetical protein
MNAVQCTAFFLSNHKTLRVGTAVFLLRLITLPLHHQYSFCKESQNYQNYLRTYLTTQHIHYFQTPRWLNQLKLHHCYLDFEYPQASPMTNHFLRCMLRTFLNQTPRSCISWGNLFFLIGIPLLAVQSAESVGFPLILIIVTPFIIMMLSRAVVVYGGSTFLRIFSFKIPIQ